MLADLFHSNTHLHAHTFRRKPERSPKADDATARVSAARKRRAAASWRRWRRREPAACDGKRPRQPVGRTRGPQCGRGHGEAKDREARQRGEAAGLRHRAMGATEPEARRGRRSTIRKRGAKRRGTARREATQTHAHTGTHTTHTSLCHSLEARRSRRQHEYTCTPARSRQRPGTHTHTHTHTLFRVVTSGSGSTLRPN